MQTTDWINISLVVFSLILAAISVITVIITLKQNNKMLEESTRPILSIYTDELNSGMPVLFFVVKNFGRSPAVITSISSDVDFKDFLIGSSQNANMEKYDPIVLLKNAVVAPDQSRKCTLDYSKTPNMINILIEYKSSVGKKYKEAYSIDLKAGVGLPSAKVTSKEDHGSLEHISYTLQEMLQKKI